MFVNHWGKWVDSNQPVGGVVSVHSVEWIDDECNSGREIDLTWESVLLEFKAQKLRDYQARYGDRQPSRRTIAKWVEELANGYEGGWGDQQYLIGDWVKDDNGLYDPDPAGEYAAIVNYDGGMTIQIVYSKWVTRAALCSPCYPGQVDLDTPGEYLGFDLPPELYGERRQNPNTAQLWNPPLYTITVQVHRVIDGVVQVNPSIYEEENLFYATAQAPRGDLQHITNIARGLWNLADDQLQSMPQ